LHRGVESGVEQPYVVQPSGRDLATNVDLRIFSEADGRDVAATLADSGFGYARQEFSWAEIEPQQGQYSWASYDAIVKAMAGEGVAVIAVVVDAPGWATAGGAVESENVPPSDPATIETFMRELTSRYGDDIPFIQFWDQPNLARQWGGRPASGQEFEPFLAAAFYGARGGNPDIGVITPELAPESDVPEGMTDLEFLASLYDANAEGFFDVVGIRLDGGTASPDDRFVSAGRRNISRAVLFRELMVEHGDGSTPVWATTYGWAASDSVSRDEQAEYVVRGLQRAWSEWPWMGLMVQWSFAAPPGDAGAAYAIAPDGASTPLFRRLKDPEVVRRSDLANTGFAPMDADAIAYEGNWADQHLEGRTFRTTSQVGSTTTFRFQGTGLIAFIRSGPQSGLFRLELDGEVVKGGFGDDESLWSLYYPFETNDLPRRLLSNLEDSEHVVRITLMEPGELTLGGLVVERDPPFTWPVILLTVSAVCVLFLGVRSFIYLAAIRSEHITRREDMASISIPLIPEWRSDRRL
jgi:polysaccharide biosynthesis protein PslG